MMGDDLSRVHKKAIARSIASYQQANGSFWYSSLHSTLTVIAQQDSTVSVTCVMFIALAVWHTFWMTGQGWIRRELRTILSVPNPMITPLDRFASARHSNNGSLGTTTRRTCR